MSTGVHHQRCTAVHADKPRRRGRKKGREEMRRGEEKGADVTECVLCDMRLWWIWVSGLMMLLQLSADAEQPGGNGMGADGICEVNKWMAKGQDDGTDTRWVRWMREWGEREREGDPVINV
ncbi:hypothetical protein GY45DRAFT_919646 [Cubamyces sp. BRFM 1775]|nr:hypothetical protein GY45DRAFT_919646 [Cubamyces sp. BRFM 1775]